MPPKDKKKKDPKKAKKGRKKSGKQTQKSDAEEAEQQCRWRASISAAQTAAEQVLLVVPDLV